MQEMNQDEGRHVRLITATMLCSAALQQLQPGFLRINESLAEANPRSDKGLTEGEGEIREEVVRNKLPQIRLWKRVRLGKEKKGANNE